ncbi:MAG: FtsX-like permease family protein [Patescibacteria group bacterium]|nr:FtsX-like permease family protein [Patescibacteria group bacterium]
MKIRDLIRRSGRSLKSAKGRTILTALAIAVGTFALSLTLAASNGATTYVNKIINDNFDPSELIVTADDSIFGQGDNTKPREYDPSFGTGISNAGATTQIKKITQADINKLSEVEGVERVREDITVNANYITRAGEKKYVATIASYNPAQKPELLSGDIDENFSGSKIILPDAYLADLGFDSAQEAVGKKVLASIPRNITPEQIRAQLASGTLAKTPEEFAAQAQANAIDQELTIVAVSKKPTRSQPGTELYILTPIEEARRLNDLSLEGTTDFRTYNFVLVKVEDGKDPAKLSAAQQKLKDLGYQVRSVKETQEFLTNIIGVLQGIVAGFAFIAIIASIFGIINTMYISVLQRTREIGLMKALGMRKRDIGRLFRFEAAWIGFLGGVVGSALAVALGLSLNPWITRQLNLGEGNNILIFNPIQIAVLVGSLMFISILAGWLPSRKAAKLDPIEALRAE